jgi:hypothetical protein
MEARVMEHLQEIIFLGRMGEKTKAEDKKKLKEVT